MNTALFFKLLLLGFSLLGVAILVKPKLFFSDSQGDYSSSTKGPKNVTNKKDGGFKKYRVNRYGQIFEE